MIYRCTRAEIICHTKISLKSGMKYVKKKKEKKFQRGRNEKNFEINAIMKLMH